MSEVTITRKQIIVVGEVGTNSYGDLTWTDKEGRSYKVKSARKQYFEAIVPGQAVEINFSEYKGIEYPYSATAVKEKIEVVEPTHLTPRGGLKPVTGTAKPLEKTEPKPIMSKDDWSEKDRITRKSIERQTALNNAVAVAELVKEYEITTAKIIATAKLFEAYLEGNYLVDEAKKLGAT